MKIDIANKGIKNGEEVVQLYVEYPNSKIDRPIKQLKAFKRVYIESGKTEEVTLIIPQKELAYWNIDKQAFTIEPGKINILIGTSSEDIRSEGSIKL